MLCSGTDPAQQLLETPDPPTAITTTADKLAVGVYQAAHLTGIRIPEDIALTSNDNSELSAIGNPGLTSVTLPVRRAGELAVENIRNIQDGNPGPSQIILNVELILRQSCGCEGKKRITTTRT